MGPYSLQIRTPNGSLLYANQQALANVDLYLGFSRAYAVRGLRAFAEAMTAP